LFLQVVDETDLKRKTSTSNNADVVASKSTFGHRTSNLNSASASTSNGERFNEGMDQVNLSDDENSPARRAQIRGKHFSKEIINFSFNSFL
jgi:hypothetical protein